MTAEVAAVAVPFGENVQLSGATVVYGGSFDPPHMGHQMACLYLLEALDAQEVWLMPANTHAFGKSLASFAHRRAMCEHLARPFGARVLVSSLEAEMGGPSRTFDTVARLGVDYPARHFALAIGADLVGETGRWHRWAELVQRVPVVVVGRRGYSHPASPVELPAIASNQVRERLEAGLDVTGLMPWAVAHYIDHHRIYAGG